MTRIDEWPSHKGKLLSDQRLDVPPTTPGLALRLAVGVAVLVMTAAVAEIAVVLVKAWNGGR